MYLYQKDPTMMPISIPGVLVEQEIKELNHHQDRSNRIRLEMYLHLEIAKGQIDQDLETIDRKREEIRVTILAMSERLCMTH